MGRLFRSQEDRMIAGVAAGLAKYFNVDVIFVRLLWEIPAPIKESLFNTTKKERVEHNSPAMNTAKKALCINPWTKTSIPLNPFPFRKEFQNHNDRSPENRGYLKHRGGFRVHAWCR
jgi:hypothetical protein